MHDPIVITGIGLVTAIGNDRESTWQAVQNGVSGVRRLERFGGLPDRSILAAPVEGFDPDNGRQKNVPLALAAAREAIADSGIAGSGIPTERFGSSISVNTGESPQVESLRRGLARGTFVPQWWREFMPNNTAAVVPSVLGLTGPRLCNSSACASGTVTLLQAARALQDHQCDAVLAGAAQSLHPLLVAGFRKMRVLAQHDDPQQACRPFDENRTGFVMGEGAAMLVLERRSDALARGAEIYAEIVGGTLGSDAHHVTDLSTDSTTLVHLLSTALRKCGIDPDDVHYINAHGTGTLQNDVMESRAIRLAFRSAADSLCVSSTKAVFGHLVNAAGAAETAITALSLRDGFAPPTVNLTHPDPECDLDCVPLVGRRVACEHAVKISIAFGGHLAAIVLRRWSGAGAKRAPVSLPLAA